MRDPLPHLRVYPRVYGGTLTKEGKKATSIGLSPRVRGNREPYSLDVETSGSIPACTGEPWRPSHSGRRGQVYPRVYGGTRPKRGLYRTSNGLSPRVRGNLASVAESPAAARSIPACTGEPSPRPESSNSAAVYPRVYGGTITIQSAGRVGGRSIPACTGEPTAPRNCLPFVMVYPRVYGGTELAHPPPRRILGLSPRVRGNHLRFGLGAVHAGSIPACTGEPRFWNAAPGEGRVYPRVYGGTQPLRYGTPQK